MAHAHLCSWSWVGRVRPMSASKQSGYDDFDRPTMFEAHRSLGHDQFLELILG